MTGDPDLLRAFVLEFLREIEADVREEDGVFHVAFPQGRKRRYGRERAFTFDAERRREHVELLEPGSPLLKMLVEEAQEFGVAGAAAQEGVPEGTRLYVVQFDAFSSVRKRTGFAWARLDPAATEPVVGTGLPPGWERPVAHADLVVGDLDELRSGYARIIPALQQLGRTFSQESVAESYQSFRQALTRVDQYFQGMYQDTFLEEARIRKRLGEIQSKLYFTEDGLRELKLQKEADRLQQELHALKKQNTERSQDLVGDKHRHEEQQRRRHEPKLKVRLLAAVYMRSPSARGRPEPVQESQPAEAAAPPVGRAGNL